MGYFTSAFVFTEDPQWESLANAAASMAILAVRHEPSRLGLLTVWGRGDDEPELPFVTQLEHGPQELAGEVKSIDPGASRQIERLVAASSVVRDDYGHSVHTVVRPALESGWLIHNALRVPLFFSAGDDDGLNLAFHLVDGQIQRFKIVGENGLVECVEGQVQLTPVQEVFEDEEDDDPLELDLSPLEDHPDVVIHPTRRVPEAEMEGGMFSATLDLWPSAWPPAGPSIGLGTWDPLAGYPTGYETLFARR